MKATKKQIAMVHVAKNRLAIDDEVYRAILLNLADVESSRDLDQTGFELVMQYMIALGFKPDWPQQFFGHRPSMASPKQVYLIRSLWDEYTATRGDSRALDRWLERTFKVSALRFMSGDQSRKAITALKAMKVRQKRLLKAEEKT